MFWHLATCVSDIPERRSRTGRTQSGSAGATCSRARRGALCGRQTNRPSLISDYQAREQRRASHASINALHDTQSSSDMPNFVPLGNQGADQQEHDDQDCKFRTELPSECLSSVLRAKVTLLRSLPLCREMMAKSSGLPRAPSGSETVTTVPSCPRRSAINSEHRLHSQKYSTRLWLLA